MASRASSSGRNGSYGYGREYYAQPTAAELKSRAAKSVKAATCAHEKLDPVVIEGRKIATTWWGLAWCRNLESYADYSNRIARGRSYVRAGSVIDLSVGRGRIRALVQGSRRTPYTVTVGIDLLQGKRYQDILERCGSRIETLEALAEGDLPQEMEQLYTDQKSGLFPSPAEIHFNCSCPDHARMCKHVAAVLYAVGNRLDRDPLRFFELRGIDATDFIQKTVEKKLDDMLAHADAKTERTIDASQVSDLFGIVS